MAWNEFIKAIHSREYFERAVPIIILGVMFNFFWGLVTPIFSIRIDEITGSFVMSGLILGMWGIIKFFLDIPSGTICSKFGSKKVIRFSLVAYMFISFMYTVVDSTLGLILLRATHSVFGSLFWVSFWSLLRGVPKEYIGEEISLSTALRNIALFVAPLIGSVIILAFSWRAPFYVLSSSFVLMFIVSRMIPESRRKEGRSRDILVQGIKNFAGKGKKSLGVMAAILVYGTSASFLGSFLPIIMNNIGHTISEIGMVMSFSASLPWIVMPILILSVIDKKGVAVPIVIGISAAGLGFLLLISGQGFLHLLLSVFIVHIGLSTVLTTTNILVGQMADGENMEEFTGVSETFKDLSSFIGSFGGGFLLQYFSHQAFGLNGLVLLASAPAIYLLLR